MPLSREFLVLRDFSGGLNTTDQQELVLPNESPDLLNVDVGRSGFRVRGGFQSQNYDSLWDGAIFLGPTYFADDVLLALASDGSLLEWDGAALTDTTEDLTDSSDRVRMAVFDSTAYFANCYESSVQKVRSWDGTTLSTLGQSWNNDYTTPDTGNMPLGKFVRSHSGHMWTANFSGASSRVRFSHLQYPEAWAQADYFDLDPDDEGDVITGLERFRDRLLIFKRSGVYSVYGYDRDTFVPERVSGTNGVCSCGAMAANEKYAYWFSTSGRLMVYDGTSAVPATGALDWWSDTGRIRHGGAHRLLWHDGRLWMRLQAGPGESVSHWMFVYDPSLGSVVLYSPDVSDLVSWPKVGSDADPLFLFADDSNLYRYDRGYTEDSSDLGAGPVSSPIAAHFRSAWITAGETARRKKWKRPKVTSGVTGDATIRMRTYHDFSPSTVARQSERFVTGPGSARYGTAVYGTDTYTSDAAIRYDFEDFSSGGSAYAVQYEFSSPDNVGHWWVDSVTVPFRRKTTVR